jgi:regulator of protease activity HflC (stomatin/prohibitin superfamily)
MAYYSGRSDNDANETSCSDGSCSDCLYRYRWVLFVFGVIGGILLCILIPISFGYVEPGQVALPKNRISKTVDDNGRVYKMTLERNGRYWLGLSTVLESFDSRIQQKTLDLDVVASNSRGFILTIVCYYRINTDELGLLFNRFKYDWKTSAQGEIVDTIKGITTRYSINQYIDDQQEIQEYMGGVISDKLREIHLLSVDDVLIIKRVDFTGTVDTQFLDSVIQEQTNERQLFQREVDLIQQTTETDRRAIVANRTLITAIGQAEATRIVNTAHAEASKIRNLARTQGFSLLFTHFDITSSSMKTDFLEWYAKSNNLDNIHLLYDVNNAIVQLSGS